MGEKVYILADTHLPNPDAPTPTKIGKGDYVIGIGDIHRKQHVCKEEA